MSLPLSYPIHSIVIGGRVFGADYSFPCHVQSVTQFYAVLEGKVRVWVEGQTVILSRGQALWMAPWLRREPRAASKAGRYVNVMFRSPWPQLGAEPGRKVLLDRIALARAVECADLGVQKASAHVQAIAFHSLCLYLLGPEAFSTLDIPSPAEEPEARGQWIIARLEEFMAANVNTPLGIEDMASLVHVSRATLGRLFREHLNTSPIAHFRDIRLKRAMQLLRTSRLTITEIALETGFSSSQHFATVFRQRFGEVPSSIAREQIMYVARSAIERNAP
ncbi:MAG: helix-turn-helix domain-containing protein [Candidatus Methylacidiphilales bacterium]|nr:AraC family transcriptional regulator [Candidatus Methylacidiphilales bacterium]